MIASIFQKLVPGGLLYVRIKHDWLSVRDVKTGHCYEDVPVAALAPGDGTDILAVGFAASNQEQGNSGVKLINGFDDPHTLISHAGVAEQTLRYFMDSVVQKGLLQPPLKVILHPTGFARGRFPGNAARALQQLALRAGAAEAYVWVGIEPMKSEIIDGDFPARGEWLTEPPGWVSKAGNTRGI